MLQPWHHYVLLLTCLILSLRMLYFSQCTLCVLYNEHIQLQDLTQEAQIEQREATNDKGNLVQEERQARGSQRGASELVSPNSIIYSQV